MKGHPDPGLSDPSRRSAAPPEQLLTVLLQLYEIAQQPEPWPRILRLIAPLIGTDKAFYARVDRTHPRDSVTEAIGLVPEHVQALRDRDLAHDHIWRAVIAMRAGNVFRTSELFPEDLLHSSPLYEQIGKPAGIEHILGAIVENTPQFFSTFSYMQSDQDFTDGQKATIERLLPYLQTAQKINRRITAGDAGRREALLGFDRVRQALVVLDCSGYAIYRNECAAQVLANAKGLELKLGRFLFDNVAAQCEFEGALRAAIAATLRGEPPVVRHVRVPRRDAGSPYTLAVVALHRPSHRALMPDGAGCMVLIHDHESLRALPLAQLASLYRLTPGELRICDSLYRAGSVEAAALALRLTQHTVRSHLKSIFSKFGVTNQGQLMLRLAQSTGPLSTSIASDSGRAEPAHQRS